ncbi:MAG: branched-chain amino acid transport system substrate-binding protein [Paracoccaceae bacterium]|jgi:branched-chain amino acid transport system substrate-binding protein
MYKNDGLTGSRKTENNTNPTGENTMKKLLSAALAATMLTSMASAAEIKIGYVSTLSTGGAVIGNDIKKAVELAVSHIGGKMGDLDVNVIWGDDGFKPETGKQVTDKLVKQDNVDIVAGYIWSHVLLASRKSVLDAGKFLITANAGPGPVAGKLCHENFFSSSWQNDQTPMAMGEVLNQNGVKSLYVIAPNYAAGKGMVAGVKRTFKGEILGTDMTTWPTQLDFSAELAKAKASGAEGLFVFYPGKAGGAFMKQYQQAGLKDSLPLYTTFTVDALSLPKFQAAGFTDVLGSQFTQQWDPTLDNAANAKFVGDFRAAHGAYPSFYAAQAYDSIMMIKGAVEAVDGDLTNMDGMRSAMESQNYDSVRGKYTYGNNHMPIQAFYLREVVEGTDGNWTTKVVKTVYEAHQDTYAQDCALN